MNYFIRTTAICAAMATCASPLLANPSDSTAPTAAKAGETSAMSAMSAKGQFDIYDGNKDGTLDKSEFAAWVAKLRTPAPEGETASDKKAWSDGLFAQADTNKDKSVSRTEMSALLSSATAG